MLSSRPPAFTLLGLTVDEFDALCRRFKQTNAKSKTKHLFRYTYYFLMPSWQNVECWVGSRYLVFNLDCEGRTLDSSFFGGETWWWKFWNFPMNSPVNQFYAWAHSKIWNKHLLQQQHKITSNGGYDISEWSHQLSCCVLKHSRVKPAVRRTCLQSKGQCFLSEPNKWNDDKGLANWAPT